MAGVACGLSRDMPSATRSLVAIDCRFEPDGEAARIADDRFGAYKDLYAALSPVTAKMSDTD